MPAERGARTTRRRGRMTEAKRVALVDLSPRWGLPGAATPTAAELAAAFGRDAPRLLDIGPGSGEATRAWAEANPDHDVLAVELHRPGIARLLQDLEAGGPPNVRVLEADVTALLDRLATTSGGAEPAFHAVRVLFPDPWPKRRHVDRRLVDRAFVARLGDLLPPGGWLHLATDWDDYADQMRDALAHEPRFHLDTAASRPDRPVTAYERRGLHAGRRITDLVAHRLPDRDGGGSVRTRGASTGGP